MPTVTVTPLNPTATASLRHHHGSEDTAEWYVMRDLTPANARESAYKKVADRGLNYYTPMKWVVRKDSRGRCSRVYVPVIHDLLFIRDSRAAIDAVVADIPRLQYRYRRGQGPQALMTVGDSEMNRFMTAVAADASPVFFTVDELTPDMIGREICVTGGPLDGYQGRLLKMQGSKKRRLIVALEGYFAAAVEVNPQFIRLL